MLPRLCSPPPPTPLMGLSYGEQSHCRVPPSPVHPHEGAPMLSCSNFFIFEAKSLICSLVGAFLWGGGGVKFWPTKSSMETRLKHLIPHNFVNNRRKYTKLAHMIGHDPPCWFTLIYIGHVTLRMKARLKHIIYYKFVQKNPYHAKLAHLLTIRPVARKGYGSIAHEAKPNGLLTRGPWGRRV